METPAAHSSIRSGFLRASAGSGKTYALATRFCQLLMARERPESICALTFTRAATREIFSKVIARLLDTKDVLETPPGGLSREEALDRVLEALPKLQIATIDAFTSRVARLFAYELGLNPDFSLYDDGGAEGKTVLREVVWRAMRITRRRSAMALLRQFNIQTAGMSPSQSLLQRLQGVIETYGALMEAHPQGWGDLSALGEDLPACLADRLGTWQELNALPERMAGKGTPSETTLEKFHALLTDYRPDLESAAALKAQPGFSTVLQKLNDMAEAGYFAARKNAPKTSLPLDRAAVQSALALREDVLARDLEQTAKETRALAQAVRALNGASAAFIRETGRMSFTQLTNALAQALGNGMGLTLSPTDSDRLYVSYRLDTAIRHLMIDEFQDTSKAQWQVLSGLAHELAENPERTFFYVGDVKQSIYGWRGGDATLFGDFTRVPKVEEFAELAESHRSCPAVIRLVNQALSFPKAALETCEPWQRPILQTWRTEWQRGKHRAHNQKAPGYAAMMTLPGDQQRAWMEVLADVIAARWRMLKDKHLSMAVLAAQNKIFQGTAEEPGLLEMLRARNVACAMDGRRRIGETPFGQLITAMLHWLADPRATLWGEVARQLGMVSGSDRAILGAWNRILAARGYAAWLDELFGAKTPMRKRLSNYDVEVFEAVREVLMKADAEVMDPAEAAEAVRQCEVPCQADANMLSLMTIHHSKGLTFDVVFTILSGGLLNEASVLYETGADWVLERPCFRQTYDRVAALREAQVSRQTTRFRDDLCGIYVAITRARSEQLVFVPEKESSQWSKRGGIIFPQLANAEDTAETVWRPDGTDVAYATGDAQWWQGVQARQQQETPTEAAASWQIAAEEPAVEVEIPSERAQEMSVAEWFEAAEPKRPQARQFGISEHLRLADVAWSDTPPRGLFPEVFRKPDEPCELWRERTFCVCLSETKPLRYIAGQFDRVHLFPQSKRAVIYDFKTSREAALTPAYARQMRDYRTALMHLTGFPEAAIRMVLLFTRSGRVVEVPDA